MRKFVILGSARVAAGGAAFYFGVFSKRAGAQPPLARDSRGSGRAAQARARRWFGGGGGGPGGGFRPPITVQMTEARQGQRSPRT